MATLATETPLLVDCRYQLSDPQAGFQAYRQGHIPGACYLSLSDDLSSPGPAQMGRHPLPSAVDFGHTLATIGFAGDRPVIAYDDAGGQFAARFWWLCKWAGFDHVALLDGGWQAWLAARGTVSNELQLSKVVVGPGQPGKGILIPQITTNDQLAVSAAELSRALSDANCRLIDARAGVRYRGEQEPLDRLAGHIPGAINHPNGNNLDGQLRFLSAAQLAKQFQPVLGGWLPEKVIHSCGSGVTACHNLFAMELAGLTGSRLFAPSWSGWIAEPGNHYVQGDAGEEGELRRVDP